MSRLIYIVFIIVFQTIALKAQSTFLDQFQWENRLLIIYENGESLHQKADMQAKTLLYEKINLKDRKLRVFRYNGKTTKQLYPPSSIEHEVDLNVSFKGDYEMILIGLDGGLKKRYSQVKKPKDIFDLIDSMPMRQSEIRSKKGS